MLLNLYYNVVSFFDFLGVYDLLYTLIPQAEQLGSFDTAQFFYITLIIVGICWVLFTILTFVIQLVGYILGVIFNG